MVQKDGIYFQAQLYEGERAKKKGEGGGETEAAQHL